MSDFESFKASCKATGKPVIVYFGATWCTPCKLIKPTFLELAKSVPPKAEFRVLDADEDVDLFSGFEVKAIPEIKVLVDGEVKDVYKGSNKDALKAFVAKHAA
jgi:thiol-disulfide isomerase/thioredoxin